MLEIYSEKKEFEVRRKLILFEQYNWGGTSYVDVIKYHGEKCIETGTLVYPCIYYHGTFWKETVGKILTKNFWLPVGSRLHEKIEDNWQYVWKLDGLIENYCQGLIWKEQ